MVRQGKEKPKGPHPQREVCPNRWRRQRIDKENKGGDPCLAAIEVHEWIGQ
jgi:hypothetical protein